MKDGSGVVRLRPSRRGITLVPRISGIPDGADIYASVPGRLRRALEARDGAGAHGIGEPRAGDAANLEFAFNPETPYLALTQKMLAWPRGGNCAMNATARHRQLPPSPNRGIYEPAVA